MKLERHFWEKIEWQTWLFAMAIAICFMGVQKTVEIMTATQPDKNISRGVEYFEDVEQRLDIKGALELPDQAWHSEQTDKLFFGMEEAPYWFRFETSSLSQFEQWLLEIDYALLDNLDVWMFSHDGLVAEYHTGDTLPFRARQINHEKYLFSIPATEYQNVRIYIKAKTQGTLRLPINIWQQQNFLVYNGEHSLVMGVFFGFMIAMGLSNFFFYITTRSITFLVYCGYVLGMGLTLATLHGLGYKYLWPYNIWLQERGVGIFANATIFFAIVFTFQLLNVRAHSEAIDGWLRKTAIIFLISLCLSFVLPYAIFIKVFLVMLSCVVLLIYGIGIWLWRKGVKIARMYTLAWTVLLLSAFLASLDNLSIVELSISSNYLLMLGATIETILLAVVLALNYSEQREDMFEAQEIALTNEKLAREAQAEIIRVQEQAQADLEYKVDERTLELQITLRELSETNRELEQKNTIDSLTGIRNRRYFDKKYTAEIRRSRREKTPLTVVMVDIDHFKKVNDTLGHLVGDECIRFVAKAISNKLKRPSDDVCRYGGEEFAILMPNTDKAGAVKLLDNIRIFIADNPVTTLAGEVNLTVSVGISTAIIEQDTQELLLLNTADKALYMAKEQGRNQTQHQYLTETTNSQEL